MPWLAVDPAWRGQRYGRSALTDALRRCGRAPMTVEADDGHVGWFQTVGFKIVGRRVPPGGDRYRLGWYAPRRPDESGYGCTRLSVERQPRAGEQRWPMLHDR